MEGQRDEGNNCRYEKGNGVIAVLQSICLPLI
jgi:hypothetical protein